MSYFFKRGISYRVRFGKMWQRRRRDILERVSIFGGKVGKENVLMPSKEGH
jgi:hypothetical protein